MLLARLFLVHKESRLSGVMIRGHGVMPIGGHRCAPKSQITLFGASAYVFFLVFGARTSVERCGKVLAIHVISKPSSRMVLLVTEAVCVKTYLCATPARGCCRRGRSLSRCTRRLLVSGSVRELPSPRPPEGRGGTPIQQ